MTCKDCLYYEVCINFRNNICSTDQKRFEEYVVNSDGICDRFKNEADFVEVVRCEKCQYGDVSTISKDRNGEEEIACYCTLKNRVTDLDSYCPSGKRK